MPRAVLLGYDLVSLGNCFAQRNATHCPHRTVRFVVNSRFDVILPMQKWCADTSKVNGLEMAKQQCQCHLIGEHAYYEKFGCILLSVS